MTRKRILVVDDEPGIVRFIRNSLKEHGYEVRTAMNGLEALHIVKEEIPDLIILDIVMPEMDGFETCCQIREWSQVPIIILSSLGDENDIVKLLNAGADDYITKPFGKNELLSRISAVMRRIGISRGMPAQTSFASGNLKINFLERRVSIGKREVKLTPTEYKLLQELVINKNKVLTHSMLLHKIWGPEYGEEKEYLRVFIGRLRKLLEPDPSNPKYIITISGVGYQFKS